MKVLALNSSPRVGRESKTEIMLDALFQGMKEAGAEVEIYQRQGQEDQFLPGLLFLLDQDPPAYASIRTT